MEYAVFGFFFFLSSLLGFGYHLKSVKNKNLKEEMEQTLQKLRDALAKKETILCQLHGLNKKEYDEKKEGYFAVICVKRVGRQTIVSPDLSNLTIVRLQFSDIEGQWVGAPAYDPVVGRPHKVVMLNQVYEVVPKNCGFFEGLCPKL